MSDSEDLLQKRSCDVTGTFSSLGLRLWAGSTSPSNALHSRGPGLKKTELPPASLKWNLIRQDCQTNFSLGV